MKNTEATPVSKRLERQVRSIVNEIFQKTECAGGCGCRLPMDEMTLDGDEFYCDKCLDEHIGERLDTCGQCGHVHPIKTMRVNTVTDEYFCGDCMVSPVAVRPAAQSAA